MKACSKYSVTKSKLNQIGMDVEGECPFRLNEEENINPIFKTCDTASIIWSTINIKIVLTQIIQNFIL